MTLLLSHLAPGTWRFIAKFERFLFFNDLMIWTQICDNLTQTETFILQSYAESIFRSDHPPWGGPGHSKPTYQPAPVSECVTALHMCKWSLFLVGVRSKNSGVCNINIPEKIYSAIILIEKDLHLYCSWGETIQFSVFAALLSVRCMCVGCVVWDGDTCSQDILLLAPARPPGPCHQPRHGKERWGHLLGQRGAASRYPV